MTSDESRLRLADYLSHMLEAVELARGYVSGISKDDFLRDRRTQQADVPLDSITGQFHEQGYVVIDDVLGAEELDETIRIVDGIADTCAGTRRLVELPWCRSLARRLAGEEPG